jgi:hypothetical protein
MLVLRFAQEDNVWRLTSGVWPEMLVLRFAQEDNVWRLA